MKITKKSHEERAVLRRWIEVEKNSKTRKFILRAWLPVLMGLLLSGILGTLIPFVISWIYLVHMMLKHEISFLGSTIYKTETPKLYWIGVGIQVLLGSFFLALVIYRVIRILIQ